MIAAPRPCNGVSTSPSTGALNTVDSSGSRYMINALRNGPMRLIETYSDSTAMVVPKLTPINATQPPAVAGPCQFQVASATSPSTTVELRMVYQLVSCGSASCNVARVTSRMVVRPHAAMNENAMPASAISCGLARIISASPQNAV